MLGHKCLHIKNPAKQFLVLMESNTLKVDCHLWRMNTNLLALAMTHDDHHRCHLSGKNWCHIKPYADRENI